MALPARALQTDERPTANGNIAGLVLVGVRSQERLTQALADAPGRVVALDEFPLPGLRTARSPRETVDLLLELDPPPERVVLERGPFARPGEVDELLRLLEVSLINRTTAAQSGQLWLTHAMENLAALAKHEGVECLRGAASGCPAVLVSPGPSLAKNIAQLAALHDRAVIIAHNRSLKPLREAGVVPHFVLVTDPLDLCYQLDNGSLDGVGAFVIDLIAHPRVVALPAGRKVFYTSIAEISEAFLAPAGISAQLGSGGSVATLALSLAVALGADPIVLCGQDLALAGDSYYIPTAPDGQTKVQVHGELGTFQNSGAALMDTMHATGRLQVGASSVQKFHPVPGWGGGEVLTSVQFDTYRKWFARIADDLRGKVQLVNATEGGAHIPGMEHIPLATASRRWARTPQMDAFGARLRASGSLKQQRGGLLAHLELTLRRLNEMAERLTRARKALKEARNTGFLERLDDAERRLLETVSQLPFIALYASAEIEAARRAGANAKNLEESLDATQRLYSVLEKTMELGRPLLSQSLRSFKK